MRKKLLSLILSFVMITTIICSGNVNAEAVNTTVQPKVLYELKDWTKITDNVYVSTGEYVKVNMVLVVYDGEATLIDLGYNEAEGLRIKNFIERNKIKLKNIILTHKHDDHVGNETMFKDMAEAIYDPELTADGQIIEMNKEKFKIIKTPGHAENVHDSVELVNEHFLVAGDVVLTNLIPALIAGGTYHDLKPTLERIKSNNYKLIIPGHGDILKTSLAIDNQLEYLTRVYNAIKEVAATFERPTTLENLRAVLYEKIKLENVVKDISVLDKDMQVMFHNPNIDIILNDVVMDIFLSGKIEVPEKKIPVGTNNVYPYSAFPIHFKGINSKLIPFYF